MKSKQLTANVERASESPSYLRIKLNHQVIFLGDFIIAILDGRWNPSSERITDDWEDNIYDPLSRKTANVSFIWEMTANLLILHAHLENILNI